MRKITKQMRILTKRANLHTTFAMFVKIWAIFLVFGLANAKLNAQANTQINAESTPQTNAESNAKISSQSTPQNTKSIDKNPMQELEANPQNTQKSNQLAKSTQAQKIGLFSYIPRDYVSTFSNSAQFLPVLPLGYTLIIKDFVGFKQQAIGWIAVVGTAYAIKYGLFFASSYAPNALSFAKRPKYNHYEAFPSGHTSSAFAGAGFLQKRYGSKLGIPVFVVAAAVGGSRVVLEKHTILQVICGGILGFALSFFCATPFRRAHTSSILPNLPHNQKNQTLYNAFLLALFFV